MEKFDENIKIIINILKNDLNNINIDFHSNCHKEIDKFKGAIFEDSYRDFESFLGNYINTNEKIKKTGITFLGVFGGLSVGGGIYSVATAAAGASITFPVIGIVLGGIYVISCLSVIGYRLIKGKKKREEEYLAEYLIKVKEQINKSWEEFEISVIQNSENYENQIRDINDLQLENPNDFLNNKKIIDENLNDLIGYIKSINSLYKNDIEENANL